MRPRALRVLRVARAVDRDACATDRARDLAAVVEQLVDVRVARLLEILQASFNERMQRFVGNCEAATRVAERDEHRLVPAQLVEREQARALLVERKLSVRAVVDL